MGNRGLLDAVVAIDDGEQRLYFRGFQVTVLGARIDDMSSPIQLLRTEEEPAANGVKIRHWFSGPDGELQLMVWLGVEQGVLRSRFELEQAPSSQPWVHYHLEDVAIGAWSESIEMVYAGQGNVVKKPAAYTLPFDGHRLATSFVGYDFAGGISIIEAADVPPINLQIDPARDHGSLHVAHTQTRTIIPTDNVWQGVKVWRDTNELQASAGVSKAAGRFVFDIWGGRYAESRRDLKRALRYGLRDSMVVWHNWQRWGYDYRLPEIYPANPRYGLHEELQSMIEDCREEGVLFALHDNYIDYYPDAQGFSYKDKIAFHSDGTPVRAWLNKGREAQSYRYRADRVEPILKENVRLIRDGLKPDAYFIDVWSSARPYDYWTADGEFRTAVTTRDTWGKLFAWIRDYLGNDAPQISESGHDQLIGWLDGAQANHLRIGKPLGGEYSWSVLNWECEDAERIPWLDAAHHDRFVLHGAGYSSRYSAGLDPRLHGMYSDDYIVTEILTGHPAMVSRPFDRNVVRKYWLTHDVLRALALRTIESVEFVDGDIHRQHVQWSGDGEVWVNRGETDWPLQGEVTLPPFGFLAKIPTADGMVTASIERKQGLIVETAIAPHDAYFNGRQLADAQLPIRMSVQKMRELGEGRAELDLQWDARLPIPAGWSPFLHFCDNEGEIVFQASHSPRQFAENSKGKLTANASLSVPADVKDGQQLELLYGIYHPKTGRRLNLAGPDSGDGRIRLGHIEVRRENGETTVKWIPFDPGTDPFLTRQNPDDREVDFGMVQTSGAIRLTRSDEGVVVTPLPGAFVPNFTIQVQWDKLPWRLPFPQHIVAIDENGSVLGDVQIKEGEGNRVVIPCQPNVFAYRLTSEKVTGED